jgi:ABC-2 type transport system permease protein
MLAVYKRELKAYLHNVYGWLFMAVLLAAMGVLIYLFNLQNGIPDIEYALVFGQYALLLLVPILCMRSMAEDKRNKTDMFYRSLPLRSSAVVLGKYFALLTILALPCLLLCLYPLIFLFFGTVKLVASYLSILCFFLLGAALIAICLFMSSLTENLVVAAVLGEGALIGMVVLPILSALLPATPMASFICLVILGLLLALVAFLVTHNLNVTAITGAALVIPTSVLYMIPATREGFGGLIYKVLSYASPFLHFSELLEYNIISIPSLILLVSYSVFFVFLTIRSFDKGRWS